MESDYKKYKKEQAYKRKKFLELAKRIEDNIIVTDEELNKAILIIKRYHGNIRPNPLGYFAGD